MVVVRPDWAGGSSVNPTPPKPYKRPPSSPGGNTFGNSAPKPIPVSAPAPYRPPAPAPYVPPYQPPQQQYIPPYVPPYQAPAQQSFQNFEPPAPITPPPPPPPPKPPVGGREWYQGLDPTQRVAEERKWLGGDSDYMSQIGEYDKALSAFVDRIAKQKKLFEADEQEGLATTAKNEGMTLNNLGEDFGARGLSYSGLFDQSKQETGNRFKETRGQITKQKTRNVTDASNREADYRGENQVGRGNARRAALQRMAAEQALKDANAGF